MPKAIIDKEHIDFVKFNEYNKPILDNRGVVWKNLKQISIQLAKFLNISPCSIVPYFYILHEIECYTRLGEVINLNNCKLRDVLGINYDYDFYNHSKMMELIENVLYLHTREFTYVDDSDDE